MFKIVKNATFAHDVQVLVPSDRGFDEEVLRVRYRVKDLPELQKLSPDGTLASQDAYLDAIVETFEDLASDSGQPITCDVDLRSKLLKVPYIRVPVIMAYERAMAGLKEKN